MTATTTETVQSRDEVQIRRLMAELATAMRERDAERLVSHYTPETVKFDLAPPLVHAGPEVLDATGVRNWFAGFDGPIHFEIQDLTVTVGEDLAFCHSLNRLASTPHGAPDGFELWFRATVCLRKVDGAWWITHEHKSTPFYMDGSFKAAVDLRP